MRPDLLLRERGAKLSRPDMNAGANIVVAYPYTRVPMCIVRLEWKRPPAGTEHLPSTLGRLCRALGGTLKLLEDRESAERFAQEIVSLQETDAKWDDHLDDLELRRLLAKVVDLAKVRVPSDHACVLLGEESALVLEPQAYAGKLILRDQRLPRRLIHRASGRPNGAFFRAFETARPHLSPDTADDPHHTPLFAGSRSSLAVPILVRSEAVGVLLVESDRPQAFADSHVRALEDLARLCAVYVAKARVYRDTLERGCPIELMCQPRSVIEQAANSASSNSPALIEGESGTGKGVAARFIHALGPRRAGPFVTVHCGGLSDTLTLSQLFGHVKGAFTGAEGAPEGFLAAAAGGTLFLDDAQVLPKEAQAGLLEFLDTGEYAPLGSNAKRRADVRVIAASNVKLSTLAEEGRFREDLYYRLAVLQIRLLPLRLLQRGIPRLVEHKLPRVARAEGRVAASIDPAALAVMTRYVWPGNYRELQNVLHRLVVEAPEGVIQVKHLPEEVRAGARKADDPATGKLKDALAASEKRYLLEVLRREGGKTTRAAKAAGLSRSVFYEKLKKHGINPGKIGGDP